MQRRAQVSKDVARLSCFEVDGSQPLKAEGHDGGSESFRDMMMDDSKLLSEYLIPSMNHTDMS